MLALYLAALGFGGTMILVSLILGGGDKELGHHEADHNLDKSFDKSLDKTFDKDIAHDADHDANHDTDKNVDKNLAFSAWWLLSMRFWTFGLATFGLTGTLLSILSVPALLTAILAVAVGLGLGFGAARLFRALNQDEVSGATELSRYVGEEARVVVPVRREQPGKIAIQSMAGRVEMLATTRDQEPLEVGTAVLVASIERGVADVSRMPVLPGSSEVDSARRAAAERAQRVERN
jgi:hypothetical protein